MEERALQIAKSLLEVGRCDDAIKQCVLFLSSQPESIQGRACLIRAHLEKDEYDKAEQAAMALIKLAPEEPFAYYLRSLACRELKRFNSALEMAETAARIDPENANYLQQLAAMQLQQGMIKKAKLTAQALLKVAPGSEQAHELMASISLELEDFKQAEIHYREVLRLNPNSINTLNNLAIALAAQKKLKQAIELLFNALKQTPNDETLRYNTFSMIKSELDKSSLKGNRKQRFEELPSAIQMFYRDYKSRTNILERYSNYLMIIGWIVVLGLASLILGFY